MEMQELSKKEIDEVNGGLLNAAIGAGAGALIGGAVEAYQGGSFLKGAFSGAVTGLSIGVGAGLLGTGLSIGGRAYRSVTAGFTSMGIGMGYGAASGIGNYKIGHAPYSRR